MSMNIGPMLRALLGENQPAEGSRALELRIGQIVRGVLLEMLDSQEALININGVQVRARLEADMPAGRGTLLQVQPGSNGTTLTLKPLADHSELPVGGEMKDVLRQFGLPDQKWAMELMRGLKRDGYSIGKQTAEDFSAAAALKPTGVDASSWMGAADVAFRRGLPLTEATIGSIRQALFGKPLHETLDELRSLLADWSDGKTTPGAVPDKASGPLREAVQRLQGMLSRGTALLAEVENGKAGLSNSMETGGKISAESLVAIDTLPETEQGALARRSDGRGLAISANELQDRDGALPAAPAKAANTGGTEELGGETAKGGMRAGDARADYGKPPNSAALGGRLLSAEEGATAPSPTHGNADKGAAAKEAEAVRNNSQGSEGGRSSKSDSAWIGRFLQWIGADHEFRALHGMAGGKGNAAESDAGRLLLTGAGGPLESQSVEHGQGKAVADSLKSALMTLAGQDDVPPLLREAAQNLVQQITGQQLLLGSERNGAAPFSHMTLFVPMRSGDGETTATVHVQTRRGRKGEWDADNCRLLFDLRMRTLGDTVVDVQVVDRIVSLKLMNDFPAMQQLLEEAKPELAAGMREAGFQLLSLSASPLPRLSQAEEAAESDSAVGEEPDYRNAAAYASKPYKGVDYRA